jgi:hypothetical protein
MRLFAACMTAAGLIFSAATTASAQATPTASDTMRPHVGSSVFVTDSTPVEKHGRLLDVSNSTLTLLQHDVRQTLAMNDVVRVDLSSRHLKTGAAIGAAVGLAVGVAVQPGGSHGEFVVGSTALATLLGVGVSELFPGRRMIYRRQP